MLRLGGCMRGVGGTDVGMEFALSLRCIFVSQVQGFIESDHHYAAILGAGSSHADISSAQETTQKVLYTQ
jgi:hypothetical protein